MEKIPTEVEAHLEENTYKDPHNLYPETANFGSRFSFDRQETCICSTVKIDARFNARLFQLQNKEFIVYFFLLFQAITTCQNNVYR